jgi:hypothetical protein
MTSLDEIADTIESFPDVLAALLGPVADATLRQRPEAGEWCPLEVIGHLLVTEGPAFRDRIAAIVSGRAEIAPFAADLELTGRDFRAADLSDLLAELRAERTKSGAFLRSLDPADLRRTATLAEHGSFTAGDFVHEWSFHDHDHLQQILASTKMAYLPFMTKSMRRALVG